MESSAGTGSGLKRKSFIYHKRRNTDMNNVSDRQQKALSELCERLNKKKIAAVINGDRQKYLSLVLDGITEKTDIFLDIAFLSDQRIPEEVSFCLFEIGIRDMSGLGPQELADMFVVLSALNSVLLAGSYSIRHTEEDETEGSQSDASAQDLQEDPTGSVRDDNPGIIPGELQYRYVLMPVKEITDENLVRQLEAAIETIAFDLRETLPGLLSFADGELSTQELFEKVLKPV